MVQELARRGLADRLVGVTEVSVYSRFGWRWDVSEEQARGQAGTQQERSRTTRERILRAAARVLSEYGYARGTTNRITEAARLSVGLPYQYFPSKDAVLAELVRCHVTDGVVEVQAAVTAGGLDLASVLERAAAAGWLDDPGPPHDITSLALGYVRAAR